MIKKNWWQKQINLVKGLLDNGFDPNYIVTHYGVPLLLYQLSDNTTKLDIDILKLLIDKGADVNLMINGSPLISGAITLYHRKSTDKEYRDKYLEAIRLFIKSGADLTARDDEKENSFDTIQNMIDYGYFKPIFTKRLLKIIEEEAPEQYGIYITSKKYNI